VRVVRLNKTDVERLLADYDADPVASLSAALRIVLSMPDAAWPELLVAAPISADRRAALLTQEQSALDALVTELNELRRLDVNR
jgi:hypothetical protein